VRKCVWRCENKCYKRWIPSFNTNLTPFTTSVVTEGEYACCKAIEDRRCWLRRTSQQVSKMITETRSAAVHQMDLQCPVPRLYHFATCAAPNQILYTFFLRYLIGVWILGHQTRLNQGATRGHYTSYLGEINFRTLASLQYQNLYQFSHVNTTTIQVMVVA
jgi:hypothetical protein